VQGVAAMGNRFRTRTLTLIAGLTLAAGGSISRGQWPDTRAALGGGTETYATVDMLAIQRDNATVDRDVVINGDTLTPALTSQSLQFVTAPGVRLSVGRHGCDRIGWEFGYVGVYGMWADRLATGADDLEIAGLLANDLTNFRNQSVAEATYGSTLNMAEANLLFTEQFHSYPRMSAYQLEQIKAVGTVDWIAGFRWADLSETAAIDMAPTALPGNGLYAVRANSSLFGGQIGARGRLAWEAWAFEGWVKAACAYAAVSQSQDGIVDALGPAVYRQPGGGSADGVAGIFDAGIGLVRRLGDTWSLRLGYNSFWLTGVALAPNQFDFSDATEAPTDVQAGSTLWLGGASVGLEAAW
jgi:hypothetical protein